MSVLKVSRAARWGFFVAVDVGRHPSHSIHEKVLIARQSIPGTPGNVVFGAASPYLAHEHVQLVQVNVTEGMTVFAAPRIGDTKQTVLETRGDRIWRRVSLSFVCIPFSERQPLFLLLLRRMFSIRASLVRSLAWYSVECFSGGGITPQPDTMSKPPNNWAADLWNRRAEYAA